MVSNDDMKFEDITANEMGCMGEDEVPDGVKEPTQPIKPQPTTKEGIFASIPHGQKKSYRKLYDGFENKDMPFDEFCIEMTMLSNPGLLQNSLGKVMGQKQMGQARQAGIDYAMKKKNLN